MLQQARRALVSLGMAYTLARLPGANVSGENEGVSLSQTVHGGASWCSDSIDTSEEA